MIRNQIRNHKRQIVHYRPAVAGFCTINTGPRRRLRLRK